MLRGDVIRHTINLILDCNVLIIFFLFSINVRRKGRRTSYNIYTIHKICTHELLQDHRLCAQWMMQTKMVYGIIVNNHILKCQIHIIWNALAHRHAHPNTIVLNKHHIFPFPFENSDDICTQRILFMNYFVHFFSMLQYEHVITLFLADELVILDVFVILWFIQIVKSKAIFLLTYLVSYQQVCIFDERIVGSVSLFLCIFGNSLFSQWKRYNFFLSKKKLV